MTPSLRFTAADAERAADEWGFNCGPAALCAALELTPGELRPHLGDFEAKGFMNPTMVKQALISLTRSGIQLAPSVRRCSPGPAQWPRGVALAFVQWDGPWCKPGVPVKARYRYTHWVASCNRGLRVFDVNAFTTRPTMGLWSDWWLLQDEWTERLVPLLLPRRATGWYLAQTIEVHR
jgi:hypothetical protein